jgi:hypothetical protein
MLLPLVEPLTAVVPYKSTSDMPQRPHGHRWTAVLVACAVCLMTLLAAAQQPSQTRSPQTTLRSSIELVRIDVAVFDERGRHVRGLTANDFTVFDRGKPQAVAAFEEVSHQRGQAIAGGPALPLTVRMDVASNQTAQSDRLVVMVVDDLHIWRGRTDTAQTIARPSGQLTILHGSDGAAVRESIRWTPDANGSVGLRVPLERLTPGAYIQRITAINGADSATRETGFVLHEASRSTTLR